MKKQLLILGLAGMLLTSCDPLKDEGKFISDNMTAESLLQGATFAQYDAVTDENGNVTYIPSETGNYIQYNFPNVSAVVVYYLKNGAQKQLSYGRSGGIFYYLPSRGSDPQQTLYFSYLNPDGTEAVAEKQFTMKVAQELDPAVKVLVSDAGVKRWRWMPTNVNGGAVWGNGGYGGAEQDGGLDIANAWWGCGVEDGTCPDKFSGQTQHAGSRYDKIKDECYALSYMEFNEDMSLTAYAPDGTVINTGSFGISNYKNNEITDASICSRGVLTTSEGAILWPFAINTEGMQPTQFNINYLDVARMILSYSEEGTAWSACTWWSFMSDADPEVLALHEWHWKPTEVNGGAVWGNGGYGGGSQDGTGVIANAWWGCGVNDGDCPDKFKDQMQHAGASYIDGEEYSTSRMVFSAENGTITLYNGDTELRKGTFEVDFTQNAELFTIGTLKTSAGAILWPFAINMNGYEPTEFKIAYLGPETMILQYPESDAAWSACTWWSFGK